MGVKVAVVLAPILPQALVVKTAHNLDLTKRTEIAIMEAAQVTIITMMSENHKMKRQAFPLSAIRNSWFLPVYEFLVSAGCSRFLRLACISGFVVWLPKLNFMLLYRRLLFCTWFSSSKIVQVSCSRENHQNKWAFPSLTDTYRESRLPYRQAS